MSKYLCKICSKEFGSYNPNPQYCSLKCKGDAQAHPTNIPLLRYLYNLKYTQEEIGKMFKISQKSIYKAMKRHGIKARKATKRNQSMENNHMWNGLNVGYEAFHKRLIRKYGRPAKCEVCGTSNRNKTYDWANLTGNYEDMEDYKRMCRSCHWVFDKKYLNFKGAIGGRRAPLV